MSLLVYHVDTLNIIWYLTITFSMKLQQSINNCNAYKIKSQVQIKKYK